MFENAVLFSVFGYCKDTIRKFGIHKGSDSNMPLKYVALSGGIAGAFASIVLSPVELVKCLVQVESLRDGGYSESRNSDGKSKRQVNNTFKMFKAVVNNQGLRGLYQGFVWTFIRETGGGAVWFCTYEYLKRSFPQNDNSPLQIVIAGGIAGIAYNFSFFPADVIKSLHQTHINPFVSSQNPMNNFNWRTEVVKLYRSGGIRPFYAGISVTLLKAFPGNATIFIMYETLKKWFG
jgi:ornithine carrier protein